MKGFIFFMASIFLIWIYLLFFAENETDKFKFQDRSIKTAKKERIPSKEIYHKNDKGLNIGIVKHYLEKSDSIFVTVTITSNHLNFGGIYKKSISKKEKVWEKFDYEPKSLEKTQIKKNIEKIIDETINQNYLMNVIYDFP
jgi:hypothetical protein